MNRCLKKDRPSQDYSTASAANAQVNVGPSRVEEPKTLQFPSKQLETTTRGKTCTPLTVPSRYATMPRLVKKPPEDVPLARHTQRAGFTRQVKRKAGRAAGPKTAPSLLPTNQTPYSDSARDWGGDSAAAHSEGPDDTDTVNKHSHTAAGSAENGAPHDTGHEDEAMPKEDDTGTGGALATAKGHETANGDMGVVQHVAQDIGSAQTNEGGDETNKASRGGSENDHTTKHKAADTDSAESKCKDNDTSHENGAESRGRAIGAEGQSDASRSQAPQGAGDETSMAWCPETTPSGAVAQAMEDSGGVESIPVGTGRVETEGASSKVCASSNTPPVRSARARGLTNTANTCFLNASLQCLCRVWELDEARARQPRRRRSLESRLLECISQLQLRLSPHYTPRPLLDTLPRIADEIHNGQPADTHEFLVCLLDKGDQGGRREVFYGSIQTVLTCSTCPHSLIQQAAMAHLSYAHVYWGRILRALKRRCRVPLRWCAGQMHVHVIRGEGVTEREREISTL